METLQRGMETCYIPLTCALNGITALLCLILIVLMASALSDPDVVLHITQPYLGALEEDLMKFRSKVEIDLKTVDYMVFVRDSGKFKIAIDALVLTCSIVGIVGVCLRKKLVILVYVSLLFVLFLAQANYLILNQSSQGELGNRRMVMKQSLEEEYQGFFSEEPVSVMWNSIMVGAECCGVDGYMDFHTTQRWSKSRNITLKGTVIPLNGDMPLACCKRDVARRVGYILNTYKLPKDLPVPNFDPFHPALEELTCSDKNDRDENNKNRGCYHVLKEIAEYLLKSPVSQVCNVVILICEALAMALCITSVLLDVTGTVCPQFPLTSKSCEGESFKNQGKRKVAPLDG